MLGAIVVVLILASTFGIPVGLWLGRNRIRQYNKNRNRKVPMARRFA